MTIRDNVEAAHRLITGELHVKHLRAVVGFSMGAEQAFQWAVSYPTFTDAIVATSGTAKCYGHGYVRLEGQIAALTTDPGWQGGDYQTPPAKGLEAFGLVWAGWLYSQEWWRQELWRSVRCGPRWNSGQAFASGSTPMRTTTFRRQERGRHDVYHARVRWRRREGAAIDQGARAIYAIETDLLSITDAVRAGVHSARDVHTDSPLWGHTAGAASNPADL
jgi:homoserine O-acetyltransferase